MKSINNPFYPIIFICFLLISLNTYSQDYKVKIREIKNKSTALKAKDLKRLFNDYYCNSRSNLEQHFILKEFFQKFPQTNYELNAIYGCFINDFSNLNNDEYAPLYTDSYQHVRLFRKYIFVNPIEYKKKLIEICINTDIGYRGFRFPPSDVAEDLGSDVQLLCTLLNKRTEKEIKHFWFVLCDILNAQQMLDEHFEKNYTSILKNNYPKHYKYMQSGIKQAREKWSPDK